MKTEKFKVIEFIRQLLIIRVKVQLLQKILAKIKVIDFLLNLSLDKEMIPSKKYIKLANKIDDITKYTVGWINSLTGSKNNI